MIEITPRDVLVVVDVQYDFLPGGSLAVAGGDEIVPLINTLAKRFTNVVFTQDWHPADHISFASQHQGKAPFETIELPYGTQVLWPDHCMWNTHGAELSADLDIPHGQLIIRKGYNRLIDSYSGFQEADRETLTGLAGYLNERDVDRLYVVAGYGEDGFNRRRSTEQAAELQANQCNDRQQRIAQGMTEQHGRAR